jgi:4-amino-4-deoxy-L-arabinose transferase-like glycosyltransferase
MTKGESAIRNPQSALVWLFLAIGAFVVYFSGLTIPLLGPDEPRYAQVAREMFERGDWITPTLGGFHWFEKPALLYWLEITSYNLFGVSEFSARLGSALFGLGTIASLWFLGSSIEKNATNNERRTANNFANWLALVAASTVGIISFAHGASFDIILTFPITAALVSFFIYDSQKRYAWLFSFYFFIGISLLAKGLVGIVFPFAIVGFYHILTWRFPTRALIASFFWGTLLAIAVASTWYLPMYLRHGWEFIDQFFIQHHFQRYTSNKYLHPQPFYFFFWVLPLMTIPWLPFFLASLWNGAKQIVAGGNRAGQPVNTHRRSLILFSIAWICVPLVFFTFSGSKLPGYILPAVPAAIILSAEYIDRFVRKSRTRVYAIQGVAAATFAMVALAIFVFVPDFAKSDSVKELFAAADSQGYRDAQVLMLHRISHNAEFYAPGRIVRDVDGKPKLLFGPAEVLREIDLSGRSAVLVLVPVEYVNQLFTASGLRSELIKDNGEFALVAVGGNEITDPRPQLAGFDPSAPLRSRPLELTRKIFY